MLQISILSSSDRLSCIEDAMLVLKMGRDLHVSYCVFPSRMSDNCDEHREHTLHPGTIEMSKDNKSSPLLVGIVTFPRDVSN